MSANFESSMIGSHSIGVGVACRRGGRRQSSNDGGNGGNSGGNGGGNNGTNSEL